MTASTALFDARQARRLVNQASLDTEFLVKHGKGMRESAEKGLNAYSVDLPRELSIHKGLPFHHTHHQKVAGEALIELLEINEAPSAYIEMARLLMSLGYTVYTYTYKSHLADPLEFWMVLSGFVVNWAQPLTARTTSSALPSALQLAEKTEDVLCVKTLFNEAMGRAQNAARQGLTCVEMDLPDTLGDRVDDLQKQCKDRGFRVSIKASYAVNRVSPKRLYLAW